MRGWNLTWAVPPYSRHEITLRRDGRSYNWASVSPIPCSNVHIDIIVDEQFYLEHSCAATIVNTPISYLTITITRTDQIFFIGMEVKWHYTSRMPSESPKRVARLKTIAGGVRKLQKEQSKTSKSDSFLLWSLKFTALWPFQRCSLMHFFSMKWFLDGTEKMNSMFSNAILPQPLSS